MDVLPLIVSHGSLDAVILPGANSGECFVSFSTSAPPPPPPSSASGISSSPSHSFSVSHHAEVDAFDENVLDLAIDAHRGSFVAALSDGTLVTQSLHDVTETLQVMRANNGAGVALGGAIASVAANPQRSRHIVSGGRDAQVRFWSTKTARSSVGTAMPSSALSEDDDDGGDDDDDVFALGGAGAGSVSGISNPEPMSPVSRRKLAEEAAIYQKLVGHDGPIERVVFSSCGRFVASASKDHSCRIWSFETHEKLAVLLHQTKRAVRSVRFSPVNSNIVVTACEDGTMRFWEWSASGGTDSAVKQLGDTIKIAAAIHDVDFSPNGAFVAVACDDMTVREISVDTRQQVVCLKGHAWPVYSVSYSPCGQLLASGSGDENACVWRSAAATAATTTATIGGQAAAPQQRTPLAQLSDHSDAVRCVLWADNRTLLTAGDKTVHIYSVERGDTSSSSSMNSSSSSGKLKVSVATSGLKKRNRGNKPLSKTPLGAWLAPDGQTLFVDFAAAVATARVPLSGGGGGAPHPLPLWALEAQQKLNASVANISTTTNNTNNSSTSIAAMKAAEQRDAGQQSGGGVGGVNSQQCWHEMLAASSDSNIGAASAPMTGPAAAVVAAAAGGSRNNNSAASAPTVPQLQQQQQQHQKQRARADTDFWSSWSPDSPDAIAKLASRFSKNFVYTPEEIKLLQEGAVGTGGQGTIRRCLLSPAGSGDEPWVVAAKSFKDKDIVPAIREAEKASRFRNRHVITTHGVVLARSPLGNVDALLLMELADCDLSALLKRGMPCWSALMRIAKMIAEGIAYLHTRRERTLWLDAKPMNVLCFFSSGSLSNARENWDPSVSVKICDFGLAHTSSSGAQEHTDVSRAGAGTLRYSSREQLNGATVSARCDSYSFGAILYWFVTGREAFDHFSRMEILSSNLLDHLVARDGCPERLLDVARRCLNPNEAKRPADGVELVKLLAEPGEELPYFCRQQEGDLGQSFGTLTNVPPDVLLSPANCPLGAPQQQQQQQQQSASGGNTNNNNSSRVSHTQHVAGVSSVSRSGSGWTDSYYK